jgi:hypothetical protein
MPATCQFPFKNSLLHEPHNGFYHLLSALGGDCFGCDVDFEDGAEGVAIGDVKEAQGADGGVDVDGAEAFAEDAASYAALVELGDGLQGGHVHTLDAFALREELGAVDVFAHHEADVIFVAGVMIKGEFDEAAQRGLRCEIIQMQIGFNGAHAAIRLL